MKTIVTITNVRKLDRLKLLTIVQTLNKWKRKIKWLASLNPAMLFIGFFVFMIIPYIPNIPLYLILLNKHINKWVKWSCLAFSIVFTIIYNLLIVYYFFK
jgi:hypothetical protein